MICFHNRYDLGDKHNYSEETVLQELASEVCPNLENLIYCWESGVGWEKYTDPDKSDRIIKKAIEKIINRFFILLPLNLYDHSGITMRTSPFSDPWDSGLVGFIYMTKEEAKKEYPNTADYIEQATTLLENEVKVYDLYLTGEVFGYDVEPNQEKINCDDSCWGYFGYESIPDMVAEAKSNIDYAIERYKEEVIKHHKEKQETARFLKTCWAD